MNIEIGIGIGGGSLFAPTSNDQLVAYAWASALSPSVSTSSVVHATINAVLANSGASALSPTVASAGNAIISSVIANADGNALVPSVAIAGSISINAIVASGNLDSMIPVVSTIRNVSVGGVVANSTATAIVPTISTSGTAPTIIVQDTFTRANSTTSLGIADTGQAWVMLGGSIWGISNNEAYWVSGADGVAVVESGISDGTITLDCRNIKKNNGIAFRAKTGTTMDGFHIQDENGTLTVYKRPAWTTVSTAPAGTYSTMKVSLNGSTIKVFLDNVEKITLTDAYNATETRHGFGAYNQLVTYDNFIVQSP